MKKTLLRILLLALSCSAMGQNQQDGSATGSGKVWTLDDCIRYAKEQNLTIRKTRLSLQTAGVNLAQAKAAYWPTLSLSNSEQVRYMPFSGNETGISNDGSTYQNRQTVTGSGNLGLNLGWTVWDGSRQRNIDMQRVEERISELAVAKSENEITESVMLLYMRVQYAAEGVRVGEKTVEVSEALKTRAEAMFKAGSISRSEQTQVESQWATDVYNLVTARSNYKNYLLQLKQTLELTSNDDLQLAGQNATDEEIMAPMPDQQEVYRAALAARPEIQSSKLSIESADIAIRKAKSGYMPSINLSAGSSVSMSTATSTGAIEQLKQGWNNTAGVSIQVPLIDGRQTRSNVEKAKIQKSTAELSLIEQQKSLYKTIETLWLDAESSQQQFAAAQAKYNSANESYQLIAEQFKVGAKHATDLASAQQTFLKAEQELLQSKYMAIYSRAMLEYYEK